jgi:hypothetical protein
VVLATGCVSITDETPNTVEHSSDGQYQLSTVVEVFGTAPRNVRAAIGTRELPMVNVGAGRWQVSASVDSCSQQTVQVRYLVDYTPAVGSTATAVEPPGATATVGGLLKTFAPLKSCPSSLVFNVNSAEYLTDATPGDGICDANPPGTNTAPKCTLRAAIGESNSVSGPATILVPAGNYATPPGDYFIPSDDVVIQGADRDSVRIGQISIVAPRGAPTVELRNVTLPFGARSEVGSLALTNVMVPNAHPSTVDGAVEALDLLSIENSTVIGSGPNGVYFAGSHARIVNSLIANNDSAEGGLVCIPTATGELEVIDSTITGNRGRGGVVVQDRCTATFRNSTITGNVTVRSTPLERGGGISVGTRATVFLSNTILADNVNLVGPAANADCAASSGVVSSVTVHSFGHNLIGTPATTCRFDPLLGATDLRGMSANLAPLADNGGPTQTMLPRTGSPALGAGAPDAYNNAYPAACTHTDQRGITRTGACDIGAAQAAH